MRVMLPRAFEVCVHLADCSLEGVRPHGEHGIGVPHFDHQLCEDGHEIALVAEWIGSVDLELPSIDLFSLLAIWCLSLERLCEKLLHEWGIGDALEGGVHVACVAQIGTAFSPRGTALVRWDIGKILGPDFGFKLELNVKFITVLDVQSLQGPAVVDLTYHTVFTYPKSLLLDIFLVACVLVLERVDEKVEDEFQGVFTAEVAISQIRARGGLSIVLDPPAPDVDLINLDFLNDVLSWQLDIKLVEKLVNLSLVH